MYPKLEEEPSKFQLDIHIEEYNNLEKLGYGYLS